MQIVGRRYADFDVIAASAAFERLRPWMETYEAGASFSFGRSPQRVAAIDDEGGAGDVARRGRGEVERKRADLVRFSGAPHRHGANECLDDFWVLLRPGDYWPRS